MNVSRRSSSGHVIEGANVTTLNEAEESFAVVLSGKPAKMVGGNHIDMVMEEDCIIFHQDAFNSFTEEIMKRLD